MCFSCFTYKQKSNAINSSIKMLYVVGTSWYVHSMFICILNKQTPLLNRPCVRWFQLIVSARIAFIEKNISIGRLGRSVQMLAALRREGRMFTHMDRLMHRKWNAFKLEILVYHLSAMLQSAVRLLHDSDFQAWLQKTSATVSECQCLLPWNNFIY